MKKILIGVFAAAVIVFACTKVSKDKALTPEPVKTTTNSNISASRTFPSDAEMDSYLSMHNEFMTDFIEGTIIPADDNEMVNAVKPYVGFQSSQAFTDADFNSVLLAHANTYESLEGTQFTDKLKASGTISGDERTVLNEIISTMDDSDYSDLDGFIANLDSYSDSQNYTVLPDSSKKLVDLFVKTYKNSAVLYHPYAMTEGKAAGAACNKCIRDNIRWILLADGVGALQGLVACLLWPPACPVLLPALIAVGSGATFWYKCKGKC